MTLDALGMCERTDQIVTPFGTYTTYEITADKLYPAALDDLVQAGDISAEDAALAKTARDAVDPASVESRGVILEKARQRFTNRLLEQNGDGTGLVIQPERADAASDWRIR